MHTSIDSIPKYIHSRLYGSYEALHQGFTTKALQDLTGGIVQSFSLSSQDRLLTYQVLNSAVPRSTLLIASINIVSWHICPSRGFLQCIHMNVLN